MAVSETTRFPCRFGFWYLDDHSLRVKEGPIQAAKVVYLLNKPAFVVLALIVAYAVIGIVFDVSYFFRSVGGFLGVLGVLMAVVLLVGRFLGRSENVVYQSEIPVDAIEGVAIWRKAGSKVLFVVFENEGRQLQRPLVMPIGWLYESGTILRSIESSLHTQGIPIDDRTAE